MWQRWFWYLITFAQSVLTVMAWDTWLGWKELQARYPPEILAAANFHIPRDLLFQAVIMSLMAAFMWARAIQRTEP